MALESRSAAAVAKGIRIRVHLPRGEFIRRVENNIHVSQAR